MVSRARGGWERCVQGAGLSEPAGRPGKRLEPITAPRPSHNLPNRLFSSPSASREVRSERTAWSSGRQGEGDRLLGAVLSSSCPCCAVSWLPREKLIGGVGRWGEASVWQPGTPWSGPGTHQSWAGADSVPPRADEGTSHPRSHSEAEADLQLEPGARDPHPAVPLLPGR